MIYHWFPICHGYSLFEYSYINKLRKPNPFEVRIITKSKIYTWKKVKHHLRFSEGIISTTICLMFFQFDQYFPRKYNSQHTEILLCENDHYSAISMADSCHLGFCKLTPMFKTPSILLAINFSFRSECVGFTHEKA